MLQTNEELCYNIVLLSDLAKQTPRSNADFELLQEALAEVKRVMTLINEDKRKTEGQLAMFDIFNDIENCPVSFGLEYGPTKLIQKLHPLHPPPPISCGIFFVHFCYY